MNNTTLKTLAGILAAAILATSCTSTSQTYAGFAGASLGSNVGSLIGAATGSGHGHHRHYSGQGAALGSLIGMGVGAALGVAIQKSVEEGGRRNRDDAPADNTYNYAPTHQNTPKHPTTRTETKPATALPLRISELTYFDGNGDGLLSKGETIEVETYIRNTGRTTLHDLHIALDTRQNKHVSISSPLTITLEPGQTVKYSGRIYGKRSRSGHAVPLTILIASAQGQAQSETLYIEMK